jgi:hypothetical protein
MSCILDDQVKKLGLSEENRFFYAALVWDLHELKNLWLTSSL